MGLNVETNATDVIFYHELIIIQTDWQCFLANIRPIHDLSHVAEIWPPISQTSYRRWSLALVMLSFCVFRILTPWQTIKLSFMSL